MTKSKIRYHNTLFLQILSEYNIKVLFWIDVHLKVQISNNEISNKIANEILGETVEKLNSVDYEFKPKNIRKNKLVDRELEL